MDYEKYIHQIEQHAFHVKHTPKHWMETLGVVVKAVSQIKS